MTDDPNKEARVPAFSHLPGDAYVRVSDARRMLAAEDDGTVDGTGLTLAEREAFTNACVGACTRNLDPLPAWATSGDTPQADGA